MRPALIASALLLGACSEPPPPAVRAERPILTAVEAPAPALEGSLIRVTGIAIDLLGRSSELRLRAGGDEAVLPAAPGAGRGELFYTLDGAAVATLGVGRHTLEVTAEGNGRQSEPYTLEIEIADALPIELEAALAGEHHWNDVEIIRGGGYISPTEGTLEAHFVGTYTPDDTADPVVDIDAYVPVEQAERFARDRGVVVLTTALGTVSPGTFSGDLQLVSRLQNGSESVSAVVPTTMHFGLPEVFGFDPPMASLGQYVTVTGAGFLGGVPDEATTITLVGTFRPFEGGAGTPIDAEIVPQFVSGGELRIEITAVEDPDTGTLVAALFRSRRGTFDGTATVTVGKGTVSESSRVVSVSFELAPVQQVVYLSFLPGFYDALSRFGLAASAGEIEARIEARIEQIYTGYNVDVRLDPPDDFSPNGYAKVEIGGTDPNGVGLFGYDNTPGKDVDNLRLFDQIGGANAETQADGAPGYGGVFVESLLYFSEHPRLPGGRPSGSPPPDPLFDEIFDPVRDRPATLDEVLGMGGGERVARVQRAIDALASIIGETTAHELGHSLGLAQPRGPRTSYHSEFPGEGCLMDSGSDRPLGERAQQPGFAETVFCADENDYLWEILGN